MADIRIPVQTSGAGGVAPTYHGAPATVAAPAGGGSGFVAGAITIVNGVITAIAVSTAGSGYTNGAAQAVVISGGGGSGATATANVASGAVQSITVTAGGSGYFNGLTATDRFFVRNSGRTILHVKKSGSGACDVTIATPVQVGGLAVADRVVAIPASGVRERFIGPLPPSVYNANGDLHVRFSNVTGLTVAVIDLG